MFCFAFTVRMDKGQRAELVFHGMELFFYLLCEREARPALDGGKGVITYDSKLLTKWFWIPNSAYLCYRQGRTSLLVSDSVTECVKRQVHMETFIILQPGTVGSLAHFPGVP